MPIVKHRFQSHSIHPATETLIVGTFNPEAEANEADFFYGRSRNFLWRLLPTALGSEDLKGRLKEEKVNFIRQQLHVNGLDADAAAHVAHHAVHFLGHGADMNKVVAGQARSFQPKVDIRAGRTGVCQRRIG